MRAEVLRGKQPAVPLPEAVVPAHLAAEQGLIGPHTVVRRPF